MITIDLYQPKKAYISKRTATMIKEKITPPSDTRNAMRQTELLYLCKSKTKRNVNCMK